MPTILDGLFHKLVNTTSSPIGVEGGGVVGSHKVAGPSNSRNIIWSNDINSGCFQLHMSQNVADQCPVSLASPVVIPCRLSAWPGELEPFTDHPSTDGCQTGP